MQTRLRDNLARTALTLAALAVLMVFAGCAPSDLAPYTFPAQYKFMGSPGDYQMAPDCAGYGELVVEDGRDDTVNVGVRYLEEGGSRYDVGMEGDVEAWLRAAAEQAFREAGISDGGGRTVTIRLESLLTDESVYRRAEYDGTVVIRGSVGDFSASKKGFAENYGYAGSAENYQETVNHALDKALADLVNDPGFRDALCE